MPINVPTLIEDFLKTRASDIYLTVGASASFRTDDRIHLYNNEKLTEEDIQKVLSELIGERERDEFASTLEYNTAINWKDKARFRMNIFRQRQCTGIVMRRIHTEIPTIASLGLPTIYADLIMEKRGLVLLVGPTGSGKSTSMAAMLEHRNLHGTGHIVTVEDPIEYVFEHRNCIITQRDVGIDTYSFNIALKNMLRQTPDVVVIGEIRDRETMEQAILFSETGHLCIATMHANNANQAVERIINFFPQDKQSQVLMNLAFNLKAILSQRLVQTINGTRTVALEILLNHALIRTLIQEGRIKEIKESIEKGREQGMQTFDQSLLGLYIQGVITEDVALAESDNASNLRLAIKQYEIARRVNSPAMRGN